MMEQIYTTRTEFKKATYTKAGKNAGDRLRSSIETKSVRNEHKTDEDLYFELSPDLLCIINFEGYFTKVNTSFVKLLGFTKDELLKRSIMEFVEQKELEVIGAEFNLVKNGLPATNFETNIVGKDGFVKWISWHTVMVREKQIIYATGRDITEEKNARNQLHEQTQHLENLIKHKTDGLQYASYLQEALFHDPKTLNLIFPESFIFHSAKDIVSGDFYWFEKVNNKAFIACADCTGHGVAGAMLSVLGVNKLHEIIQSLEFPPSKILDKLNAIVYKALGKKHGKKKMNDGMDIALYAIDLDTKMLDYSGAHNPLYVVRNGELIELAGDKQSIGYAINQKPFSNKTMQLKKDDMIYTFSDGYADQFGGTENKKFTRKQFKNLLVSIAGLTAEMQKEVLGGTLTQWKKGNEQTDDVCVIGVRVD